MNEELERAKKLAKARMIANKLAAMSAPMAKDEFTVTTRSLLSNSIVAAPPSPTHIASPAVKSSPEVAKKEKIVAPLSPESKKKLAMCPYFPSVMGCRSVQRYQKIKRSGETCYSCRLQLKRAVRGGSVRTRM